MSAAICLRRGAVERDHGDPEVDLRRRGAELGQRLQPLGAGVVVGPHRGVAELRAARRQRPRDLRVEPRRHAEARDSNAASSALVGRHRIRDGWCPTSASGGGFLQERHALDVRGLGEHVDRPHAAQPIAGLDQLRRVGRQRRRVAGDVDDPLRLALDHPAHDLLREARRGAGRGRPRRACPPPRAAGARRCGRCRPGSGRCRSRCARRCAPRRRSPRARSPAPRPRRRAAAIVSPIVPIPQ